MNALEPVVLMPNQYYKILMLRPSKGALNTWSRKICISRIKSSFTAEQEDLRDISMDYYGSLIGSHNPMDPYHFQ